MPVPLEFLKSIPYFAGLNAAELESIRPYVFEKTVRRSEAIQHEGEPANVLYFVASGIVKVFKTSADGKEQILQLIRPGESFGDVPVFSGGKNLAGAQSISAVTLQGIKKEDLETIIREHPPIALNIIRVLSRRIEHLISLVEDLSFRPVTGRVARILLENTGNGAPRLTHQEMAAMAGTVREMVGRALKALEEEGAIKMERNRIVIRDKEALKETAGIS